LKRVRSQFCSTVTNGEKTNGIGYVFKNIGEMYADQNKLETARKYYQKALKIF